MSFEFLDHTADIIIRAKGKDLKEAFEQAALGFYEVITDTSRIELKETRSLSVESEDIEALLFDWIHQLIFLFDTEFFISNKISITKFLTDEDGRLVLEATLEGETFDLSKHEPNNEVKAMTYSEMKIGEDFVEFTLDL